MSTHPHLPRLRVLLATLTVVPVLGFAPADSSFPPAGETGCRDIVLDGVDAQLTRNVEKGSYDDEALLPGVDLDEDDDTVRATHTFTATVELAKDACEDVRYLIDLYDAGDEDRPLIETLAGTPDGTDGTLVRFLWEGPKRTVNVETGWCVEFVARTVNDEGKVFDYSPDPSLGRDAVCDTGEGGTASHG